MPAKLSLASISFPEIDVTNPQNISNYDPVEAVEDMSDGECNSNCFKTWPEKHCDKLDQSTRLTPEEEEESEPSKMGDKSPVPLDAILDNIPLAYSPVTKQLHLLDPTENRRDGNREKSEKTTESEGDLQCSRTSENGGVDGDDCNDPGLMLDLTQNLGKDLVLRSCLKRLRLSPEEKFNYLWNSKIGYSDPRRSDAAENLAEDGSALCTEVGSYSSIASSLSDASPSHLDDSSSGKFPFFDSDDFSAKSHCSHDSGSNCGENSTFFAHKASGVDKCDGRRKGFSGFFSRNVFSWKTSSSQSSFTSQGWKLFGRNETRYSSDPESSDPIEVRAEPSVTDGSPLGSKKYEDVVASSSALILHNRPANLPAKSLDEEQKHKLEYQQIVEAAKRKELKETRLRKKQLQEQLKAEEQLANASRVWSQEILPKWGSMKNSKKARDLWWLGIPPCVRGKVWKLAIGNELNITRQLYEICLSRALERLRGGDAISTTTENADNEDKESSVELIQLDISRTFPHLCIFQKGGPYYDILHCLLGAYVCYRPDVGYVQGMSFIAAILILNLDAADAFISFANLLNRPCHMAFFSLNQQLMQAYYDTYNDFFRENLPRLSRHFEESSLTTDLYLLDWVYSVFAKAMPLDIACRVWDVYLRDGEEFLFRAALGILHLHKDKLMKLDFIYAAQFLTKLPEDLSANQLFKSIEAIKMNVGKQKFGQVLAGHIERRSR